MNNPKNPKNQNILDIIKDLNETNSTNDKLSKLKFYKENELFTRVLALTYDKAIYTYGLTMKNVKTILQYPRQPYSNLETVLDELKKFTSREKTGNEAIKYLGTLLDSLSSDDALVLELIIGRDLKINAGKTLINKVHKGLIKKPVYKRCGIFNKKTSKKIKFPAILQLKADGTYREMLLKDGKCFFTSRSGEVYEYPTIERDVHLNTLRDGYYFGEITVDGISNRSIGNGMINSDDCPHDDLIFSVWEYCTEEEYSKAKNKVKGDMPSVKYKDTFELLTDMINFGKFEHIQLIETIEVDSAIEAMEKCVIWMKKGLEGGVLKNYDMVMKDGTSLEQLKMKLEIVLDMKMVGTKDGKKGTKREGKVGSIKFANDAGSIKGYASGFNDAMLDEITNNIDKYMGKVFSLTCNDITKGAKNDFHALSHPRFDEWRNDKDTTDTLQRAFAQKESSMLLKNIM